MKCMTVIGAVGLCALLVPMPALGQTTPQKRAATSQVQVDQLPPAITAAIQKTYPTGSIVTAYKTTRGAEVRYQLWVKENPSAPTVVLTATEDGKIQTNSKAAPRQTRKAAATTPAKGPIKPTSDDGEAIAADQLPKPVAQAIKAAYPKDAILQTFKQTTGEAVSYLIVLNDVSHLQPMRVFVAADGTFQKR